VDKAKPFPIPKREVWEAFKRVKVNQGAAGVDGQSISDFEANLKNNLYKLWNRLSSGSSGAAAASISRAPSCWRSRVNSKAVISRLISRLTCIAV